MRFTLTRSEEHLWRRLAGSQTGYAFPRQLAIGPFIVDFACTKVRLAVDGDPHEDRARHDARRDRVLRGLGWSVLRLSGRLVLEDLDGAVALVVARAAERA